MQQRNPDDLYKDLKTLPEASWRVRGEKATLELFHDMSIRVPAYKDFLHKNGVDPSSIQTFEQFKERVPLIDKDNYLRAYPRNMLCWDGDFKDQSWIVSMTSGSTGKPYYFPRQEEQDEQYALAAEMYLRENFDIDSKSTLYIVGFPMGAWIGGVFTYQALQMIARKRGYNLSIITPGIDKKAILDAVENLGKDFDQVIIGSYAPFLKDILDDGEKKGIKWKEYNLGFIFSAEIFSEEFRDYVIRKTGLSNPYTTSLNHYGTVDLGTMAHETPFTIWLRRYVQTKPELYYDIFGETHKLPTFAQYVPDMFFFEVIEGEKLVCSARSGIPLVRYDLKDRGSVLSFDELQQAFAAHGLDVMALMPEDTVKSHMWNLPYVFVYERSDFSVSFFAFQIYPETIRRVLQRKEFEKRITGKFTMETQYDDEGRQKLTLHIESKEGQKTDFLFKEKIKRAIVKGLLAENSEYRETRKEYGKITDPEIVFWPYEDEKFFKPGTKQKWIQKGQI
jgi:phenylacetate-CoA ligase